MRRQSSARVQAHARLHRSALTATEQALWEQIRGGRVGSWFRRQVPIGNFIVDFLAPRERVIIEIDGGYHALRAAADARRDRKLTRLGYCVLRLDAELIRSDMAAALARIRDALREL